MMVALRASSHAACVPVARCFSLGEALAVTGEKLCVELDVCLSQHGFPQLSAEQKDNLKGQISATRQPDNKVRKLMGKTGGRSFVMKWLNNSLDGIFQT